MPQAAEISTQLALDRTRLAYERTLMAWVRTATSLISFGFTIYKFFQGLAIQEGRPLSRGHLFGPRNFALIMISTGLIALFIAGIQHHRDLKALQAQFGPMPRSMALMLAILIFVLGVLGWIGVALRQ